MIAEGDGVGCVSRETDEKLRLYHALLLKWQEKINLISPNTISDSWERHFEDALQLLPRIPAGVKTVYDLGSGAGFPGLVLAIARPDLSVTLIESDSKKCAFLQAVSRETGVSVSIQNKRIESAVSVLPAPDLVTARALASLEALFAYVQPWAVNNGDMAMLFPKGASWREGCKAAQAAGWVFDCTDWPSQTDVAARILLFKTLGKTGS